MYRQTERSLDLQKRVSDFMDAHIFPNEQRYEEEIRANEKAGNAYTTVKLMEELKAKAQKEAKKLKAKGAEERVVMAIREAQESEAEVERLEEERRVDILRLTTIAVIIIAFGVLTVIANL